MKCSKVGCHLFYLGKDQSLSTFDTGVRSCYDEGKRTAETLTMDYHRGADVQVWCLETFVTLSLLPRSTP